MLCASSTIVDGLAHVEDEDLAAASDPAGPDDQRDGLRDRHEVARHLRVRDRHRPALGDLAPEDPTSRLPCGSASACICGWPQRDPFGGFGSPPARRRRRAGRGGGGRGRGAGRRRLSGPRAALDALQLKRERDLVVGPGRLPVERHEVVVVDVGHDRRRAGVLQHVLDRHLRLALGEPDDFRVDVAEADRRLVQRVRELDRVAARA